MKCYYLFSATFAIIAFHINCRANYESSFSERLQRGELHIYSPDWNSVSIDNEESLGHGYKKVAYSFKVKSSYWEKMRHYHCLVYEDKRLSERVGTISISPDGMFAIYEDHTPSGNTIGNTVNIFSTKANAVITRLPYPCDCYLLNVRWGIHKPVAKLVYWSDDTHTTNIVIDLEAIDANPARISKPEEDSIGGTYTNMTQ